MFQKTLTIKHISGIKQSYLHWPAGQICRTTRLTIEPTLERSTATRAPWIRRYPRTEYWNRLSIINQIKTHLISHQANWLPDILVPLNVNPVKLAQLSWRQNIRFHLHGHVLWQNAQQQPLLFCKNKHSLKSKTLSETYQFLVLILHLQPRVYAVTSVEKRLATSVLHQIMHKQADHVYTNKDDRVRNYLNWVSS